MVKQDQNRSQKNDQPRNQASTSPKGPSKEKLIENQQVQSQKEFDQESNCQEDGKKTPRKEEDDVDDFDRNEGQGHSQKS
jgi:hypothetical protein